MWLAELMNKDVVIVMGINSGTSADAVDLAVMQVDRRTGTRSPTFLAGTCRPYQQPIRKLILEVADCRQTDLDQLVRLDNMLGEHFGRLAHQYLKKLEKDGLQVDVIASHGQTIRHLPLPAPVGGTNIRGSMQIGSPDFIAARTGKVVVSDFRQAAIAVGEEGAPITTPGMARLFGTEETPRLIINIGGMANYFYIPTPDCRNRPAAGDCGPGNSLSDILCGMLFDQPFDRNGFFASKGAVCERLLLSLLKDAFFRTAVRSTGRESFGLKMARRMITYGRQHDLASEDLVSTATELSAVSIARAAKRLLKRDSRLSDAYLMGGGRRNGFLRRRIEHHLPGLKLLLIDELGINGDFVEAAAYAVMGAACLKGEASAGLAHRSSSGRFQPVLGRISQPPIGAKGDRRIARR